MKKQLSVLLLSIFVLTSAILADGIIQVDRPNDAPSFIGYVPNKIIVKFKEDAGRQQFSQAFSPGFSGPFSLSPRSSLR